MWQGWQPLHFSAFFGTTLHFRLGLKWVKGVIFQANKSSQAWDSDLEARRAEISNALLNRRFIELNTQLMESHSLLAGELRMTQMGIPHEILMTST